MIDWAKPIELATVPPRPAQMTVMQSWETAEVYADWDADGVIYPLVVSGDGFTQIPDVPTVRNVRPGDFKPAEPTPDLAAELAEALRALIDAPEPDCIPSRKWDNARAAIAKYEASK